MLSVFGYAYTRYLSDGGQHIELVATEIYGARSVVLPVVRVPSPESARWAGDVSSAHDFDGFRCDIDVAAEWTGPMAGSREWSFAVSVTDGEVVRTTELTKIWLGGSAAVVGAAVLSDGTLAMAKTDKGQPLRLQFERNGLFASTFTLNGSQLTVEFSAAETQAPSGVVLVVSGDTDIRTARQTRQGLFTVELPRAAVGTPTTWRAYALVGGRRVPILAPASFPTAAEPNESGLRAVVTRMRRLVVEGRYRTAVIDSIRYTKDGELEVTGALFALTDLGLGLGPGSGAPDQWVDAHIADGRFDARISATRPDLSGVVRPLRSGSYALCGRADNGEDVTVVVSDSAAVELPSEYLDDFIKTKLERRSWARVGVQIAAPVATEMLGRYQRQRVIAQCSTSPRELETAVFFCVDLGGSVADSGLALHRELRRRESPLRLYWGVEDLSVPVPEEGIPVVKGSAEWFTKLNTSRFIVNNYGAIWGLVKDPGQRYLQTWHGTPLKYIGASEARQRKRPNRDSTRLPRSPPTGTCSPRRVRTSQPCSRRSSCTTGRCWNWATPATTGSPPSPGRLGSGARERSVCPNPRRSCSMRRPTGRANGMAGRAELFDGLDLSKLMSLLGPDWYVLLRGHSFNARDNHADRSDDRLVDVTRYPDINDLYLASDALITDYSSVMFDYAVTGKPMAFFTPDLKKFVATRGMYFDLEEAAPGPLYTDVAQLAEVLAKIDIVRAEYDDQVLGVP